MYCWSKSRVLCLKRNKTWRTQELHVEKISWSLADILQLPWFNRQQITTPRAPLRIMLQIFQNINSTEIIKIARMEASEARYGRVGLNLISEHVPSTALVSLKSCFLCPGGRERHDFPQPQRREKLLLTPGELGWWQPCPAGGTQTTAQRPAWLLRGPHRTAHHLGSGPSHSLPGLFQVPGLDDSGLQWLLSSLTVSLI